MDKKLIALIMALALVMALLITPIPGIADAGGFSGDTDYGGSSDWGSSDWGSSDYSGDYDGDFSGGRMSVGTLVVIVIIVILILRGSKGKNGKSGGSNIAGAQRTVLPMTIADLKQQDPAFSEEKMKEKIANLYIRMQDCWQNKKWEEMRTSMDDAIFNQFNSQLNSLIRNNYTNYMDNIAVLGVDLTGFGQDDKHDIITALVRVRLKDYTVDDSTGKLVSGSKTAEKFMTYEWTMIRSVGVKTPAPGVEGKQEVSRNCPHCGAPIDLTQSARCSYCHSIVTAPEFDWVLSNIKGIAQQTI